MDSFQGGPGSAIEERHLLGFVMGPQAWQCLLDLRSPMEPVADWGYGLPQGAKANVEASYTSMSDRERQIMHLELLRVMAAILSDVAQAMQNVLGATAVESATPTWNLQGAGRQIELNDSLTMQGNESEATVGDDRMIGPVEPASAGRVPPGEADGSVWPRNREMLRAMEAECKQYRAAQLQDWEDSILQEALHRGPLPGVGVVIRGGVVGNNGILQTTQTMTFRLMEGETLALRLAVQPPEGRDV